MFSFRDRNHRWDPKRQRPELWSLYNVRENQGESMRVFPLSNWTELDVWQYIVREGIEVVPLYFAAERPTVERDGLILMVDDERMRLEPGEEVVTRTVRFRTLGCYPLSGAVESEAASVEEIIAEMLAARPASGRAARSTATAAAQRWRRRSRRAIFELRDVASAAQRRSCCASSPAAASTTASRR